MKIKGHEAHKVELNSKELRTVRRLAKLLKVSDSCAANVIVTVTMMQLGVIRTKAAYIESLREVERVFDAKVIDNVPPFKKGGDPAFIAAFIAMDRKRKASRAKRVVV